uniref:Olfactory receptor family 5 subfamily B member 12 n=1 Tax=Balaenoptera musculus TaxID=9771 RepID=A0A8C0CNX1_BALMU
CECRFPLFIIFSLIYLITVIGNLGMIELVLLDSLLHTPMYFFLSHLSLMDFGFLTEDKIISYNACVTQFFFAVFIIAESYLLAAVAYDGYAVVCTPLHYTTTMTTNVCARLSIGCYFCGFLNASIRTGNIIRLSFCRSNVVDRFFCDVAPLLALSCSDNYISDMVIFFVVGFNALFSILVILISYLFIFITILRMRSSEGCQKAFSTYASHLTAISIFCGTGIFMYLQPSSSYSMGTDQMASVLYTMIIPMLNPLVYSLRNKGVKSVFKKAQKSQKI